MSGPAPPRDGAPATLAWLGHPVTLLGLVVLVVNDHLLKAAFPGALTGKLSDVAGLLVAPPLVAVLLTLALPRLPARTAVVVGLVAVGAGFTAVKTSGYAAEAASAAWSAVAGPSLVRADPTDLLALPALLLARWSWSRARPVRYRAARLVRLLVVLPCAVLAVAATSAVRYPYALATAVVDGRPAIATGHGMPGQWPESPSRWAWSVSDDGGVTWRQPSEAEREWLHGSRDEARGQACVPAGGQRCYRVVPGHLRVEGSDDGGRTWRTAWEVSDDRREPVARRHPDPGDVREHFASRQVAAYPTVGGGHAVLVANGRDGYALRRPDGRWERVGFPAASDLDAPFRDGVSAVGAVVPEQRMTDAVLAAALAATLGFLVLMTGAHLAVRRRGGSPAWGLVGYLLLVPVVWELRRAWDRTDDLGAVLTVVMLVLPLGGLLAFVPLVVAWRAGMPGRWSVRVTWAFLLTLVLTALPLAGWVVNLPPRSWMAVLLALAATGPGLWLAWRAARLVTRDGPRDRADRPVAASPPG